MPFYVYVLYSPEHDKVYIGFTSNLPERLKSHNELGTKGWTIKFRPWQIVFTEEFEDKAEAMKREKQLKSAQGRVFVCGKRLRKSLSSSSGLLSAGRRTSVRDPVPAS